MILHHYTSIANLALILSTRRIRFTRLDLVDDMSEIKGMPRKFGTYVFVSCWTNDEEENIALWKMYSGDMKGVRISFSSTSFLEETILAGDYDGHYFQEDSVSPLKLDELCTNEYVVLNNFNGDKSFFKKVIYDDSYSDIYINDANEKDGSLTLNLHALGMYRSKSWSFQNECRFTIYALPLPPLSSKIKSRREQLDAASDSIFNNVTNIIEHIDVEISENAFNAMVIRLGPLSTNADKIIVESLLEKHTSGSKIEESNLKGSIRK